MMDMSKVVNVRNRNNGFTGYTIPDERIWRNFAPGETKKIPVAELIALQSQPGGDYTLKHLLIVEDAAVLDLLNMDVEPEYNYTETEIRKTLFDGTVDQVKDFLDFAPKGAIEIAKEIAVKEELPDTRKRAAITEATGFNIDNAINMNHLYGEEDETEEETKKTRRVATTEAGGKTRRANPVVDTTQTESAKPVPATPQYKVISK